MEQQNQIIQTKAKELIQKENEIHQISKKNQETIESEKQKISLDFNRKMKEAAEIDKKKFQELNDQVKVLTAQVQEKEQTLKTRTEELNGKVSQLQSVSENQKKKISELEAVGASKINSENGELRNLKEKCQKLEAEVKELKHTEAKSKTQIANLTQENTQQQGTLLHQYLFFLCFARATKCLFHIQLCCE